MPGTEQTIFPARQQEARLEGLARRLAEELKITLRSLQEQSDAVIFLVGEHAGYQMRYVVEADTDAAVRNAEEHEHLSIQYAERTFGITYLAPKGQEEDFSLSVYIPHEEIERYKQGICEQKTKKDALSLVDQRLLDVGSVQLENALQEHRIPQEGGKNFVPYTAWLKKEEIDQINATLVRKHLRDLIKS